MRFSIRKLSLLMLAAVAAQLVSTQAQAGIVYNELNNIQFANREEQTVANAGSLVAGDRIQGLLYVNEINSASGTQLPPNPEVSGVFDITVAFVIASSFNSSGVAAGTAINPFTSLFTGTAMVLFRPTNTTGAEGRLAGHAPGTVLAMYEGGASTIGTLNDPLKNKDDAYAAASDGVLQSDFGWSDGLAGGLEYDSPDDWGKAGLGYFAATVNYTNGQASLVSTFYYGLTALAGPIADSSPLPLWNFEMATVAVPLPVTTTGGVTNIDDNLPFGPTQFHLVGKGAQKPNTDLAGAGTSGPDQAKFPIFSQDPAQIYPQPEPGSIALALIGGGVIAPIVRRRRQRQNASTAA